MTVQIAMQVDKDNTLTLTANILTDDLDEIRDIGRDVGAKLQAFMDGFGEANQP